MGIRVSLFFFFLNFFMGILGFWLIIDYLKSMHQYKRISLPIHMDSSINFLMTDCNRLIPPGIQLSIHVRMLV